jgi:hypothetical protein
MIVQPKERTVRVLLSFNYNGNPTEVGAQLTLPGSFAYEMRHCGKVEFIDADPRPEPAVPASPPNAWVGDKAPAPAKKGA